MRKNEFRYDTSPDVKRKDGRGHVVYLTARKGKKYKTNVITHSKTFYGEPTEKLTQNPNLKSNDKRISRFSVPVWKNESSLIPANKGDWKMSRMDRRKIKRCNQKYEKYGKYFKK